MKQLLILPYFVLFASIVQAQKLTEIKGFAPDYVGKEVNLSEIQDFLSFRTERIASALVKPDSTFSLVFNMESTKKMLLSSDNNKSYIYIEPGNTYFVSLPKSDKYSEYNPNGNFVELTFYDLPKTDINYKILELNRWTDEFVATYYTRNNASSQYFVARLDTFKTAAEKYYKSDTLNDYFNYYRKFSIAKLDDLRFLGNRNRIEKYDFFIRHTPVRVQNEMYMDYVNHFYSKLMHSIDTKTNNDVYLGIVKSSPTAVYNALSNEYTLQSNYKLRELVMIQMLSELYYEKDYPQTNILSILDSVSNYGLFPETRLVAKNISFRLTELSPGSKAPELHLLSNGNMIELNTTENKYHYLIFTDPKGLENEKQLMLLKNTYEKYKNYVSFLMITKESNTTPEEFAKIKNEYPWEVLRIADENNIFKNYKVNTFPYYVLIDPFGYIVQAPALGPTVRGSNGTIDQTFFMIERAMTKQKE